MKIIKEDITYDMWLQMYKNTMSKKKSIKLYNKN